MPRTCKNCKKKFEPFYNSVQLVCSPKCAVEYSKKQEEKKKQKAWKERKQKLKEGLKTRSDYLKEAQEVFNRYIRTRDKGKPCISCDSTNMKKINAGHYKSVGGSPELRFNENNVHVQCEYCNTYLHGNLIEYRKRLIKRIGIDEVEKLEGPQKPLKLTIPELILLKEEYKEKIRTLRNNT